MKKEKKQIKESIIGKIIYGFLMFSPLLAILVTSLYVVINPNAKDSYYGETINENQLEEITIENLKTGSEYYFNAYMITDTNNVSITIYPLNNYAIYNNQEFTNINYITIYYLNNTTPYIALRLINSSSNSNHINLSSSSVSVKFTLTSYNYTLNTTNEMYDDFFIKTYNKYSYLDNAFYYGLDSVENSSYFGWSKNTAIYSVLNTTCNGLGITATFVPMILTYWLIISVIYLIYDLVLVFIHIAHKKVHELEEF